MVMKRDSRELHKERLRNSKFSSKIRTRLWAETPSLHNPYIAQSCRCHGYDLFELIEKRTFIDVLYLLFQGELPGTDQARILETLMIGLINPGPRHPAARAAMNTGVGKSDTAHILPIGQITIGGSYLGGNEVAASMRFLNKTYRKDPRDVVQHLLESSHKPDEGDWHVVPGFGTRFGGLDLISRQLAAIIAQMPGIGGVMRWAGNLAGLLEKTAHCSWLSTGLAAAVLSDLGFHPTSGAGLFQLINSPGILAHGVEMANKPITAMPLVDNEHYIIKSDGQSRQD